MSTHIDTNSGALTAAEALCEHGHRLIDRMADYLATVDERPVSTPHAPGELARQFAEPLPRDGRAGNEVWDDVWENVVGDAAPWGSVLEPEEVEV
jgi:hypothetical protein